MKWKNYFRKVKSKFRARYLFLGIVILIHCIEYYHTISYIEILNREEYGITVWNTFISFFKGSLPYDPASEIPFQIPGLWSIYFLYYFLLMAKKSGSVFSQYEQQKMLRRGKRKTWWKHQLYEIAAETAGYVGVTYLLFLVYALFWGAGLSGWNEEFQQVYSGMVLINGQFQLCMAVFPVALYLILYAAACVQYVISIQTNVIIGFIISVILLIGSMYYKSNLLLFNYVMFVRQDFFLQNGMQIQYGILLSAAVIIIMAWMGKKFINKKDFYNGEK